MTFRERCKEAGIGVRELIDHAPGAAWLVRIELPSATGMSIVRWTTLEERDQLSLTVDTVKWSSEHFAQMDERWEAVRAELGNPPREV